jgi:hypothetical protein
MLAKITKHRVKVDAVEQGEAAASRRRTSGRSQCYGEGAALSIWTGLRTSHLVFHVHRPPEKRYFVSHRACSTRNPCSG